VSAHAPAAERELLEGDARITAEREEIKYLVPPERLEPLVAEIRAALQPHRFTGEGANTLPHAQHFVTTIYFDTKARTHFRAAQASSHSHVKLRAKEYYDLHPSLAELATDPSQIVKYSPWVWFEIKRREGSRTLKRRFRFEKRGVPVLFSGGALSVDALSLEADRDEARAGVSELVSYGRALGEELRADCLVNYRRLSWQEPTGALRVTLDLGLSYYPAPPDLWTRPSALVRSALGPAAGVESQAVLEVKRRAALPRWLEQALSRAQLSSVNFSKFVAAGKAVHGG